MNDALDSLLSQTYIAVAPYALEPYHAVVTLDDKAQARQRLVGKFKVLPPSLMGPRIYAYLGDELLNPIEVEKLEGEVRIHFLPEEIFSTATSAGDLQFMEPGRPPLPNKNWLALELFMPSRFFERVSNTKVISCTVQGLHVERPLSEVGAQAYHWRSAVSGRLTVRDAHLSASMPNADA